VTEASKGHVLYGIFFLLLLLLYPHWLWAQQHTSFGYQCFLPSGYSSWSMKLAFTVLQCRCLNTWMLFPCPLYSFISTVSSGNENITTTASVRHAAVLMFRIVSACGTAMFYRINPLSPELNPICYLLALLAHHFLHVSRIRVKSLTLRWLMSYIYGAPILDVSRSHTTTQHSR